MFQLLKTSYKAYMFQVIDGGVTSARGFKAANTAAGIKYTGRDDMAMIVSDSPCRSAGTYTKNVVKAAPVQFDRMRTDNTADIHAIVVNAGIANANSNNINGIKYTIMSFIFSPSLKLFLVFFVLLELYLFSLNPE